MTTMAQFAAKPISVRGQKVSILYRCKCFVALLLGMRYHDFRSARKFVAIEYGHLPFLVKWLSFLNWSLKQMWMVVPDAMPMMSTISSVSRTPLWLDGINPLKNHPWKDDSEAVFPAQIHTVVIGAGFTGASAAYHWAKRAKSDQHMVVLEMNEAASGASGRNQGTIVMGRYYTMVRDTVEPYLEKVRTDLDADDRRQLANQFANVYCKAAYRNGDLVEQTIKEEGFDVDYARNGWVQERGADMQASLEESIREAARSGNNDWVALDPRRVFEESGMRVNSPAGFSIGAGTWQPAKWVWSLLAKAIQTGKVSLFTHTKVKNIERQGDHYLINTDRGTVIADNVLYAVESYLPLIDSRFHNVIEPHQEQLSAGIGAPENMPSDNSITGKFYFGARRKDTLLIGSDSTRVSDHLAGSNKPCRFLTKFAFSEYQRVFAPFAWKLTNEWSGTVGYTPDEYPIIGLIDDYQKYMIGGMAGSGSGIAFNAARCIINRILGFTDQPDDYPPEYFAPSRLLDPDHHNWPGLNQEVTALHADLQE